MKKNNRVTRAARTLVEFFDVICQMTTCKFPNVRFLRQREHTTVNLSFSVFTSTALLPVLLQHALSKNNIIFKWRFRCRCCVSSLLPYRQGTTLTLEPFTRINVWMKIVGAHFPWSDLYICSWRCYVFTLSKSHGPYGRVTKHHCWYVVIIKLQVSFAIKQSVG